MVIRERGEEAGTDALGHLACGILLQGARAAAREETPSLEYLIRTRLVKEATEAITGHTFPTTYRKSDACKGAFMCLNCQHPDSHLCMYRVKYLYEQAYFVACTEGNVENPLACRLCSRGRLYQEANQGSRAALEGRGMTTVVAGWGFVICTI